MSQVNVGVLLDNFAVTTPADYFKLAPKEQYEFLSRVYSTVRYEKDNILKELKNTQGLKMHFHVSRHPEKGWRNLPNEVFAKKMAFFATKSLITFPFSEVAHWKGEDLKPLLTLLCSSRPFLKEGLVNILPTQNELRVEKVKSFDERYGLVPANFRLDELEVQFEETSNYTPLVKLYLPYFRGIRSEEVIRIRRKEKHRYEELEERLGRLLNAQDDLYNEKTLLSELSEIDQHIQILNDKFKALQDAYHRSDICLIIGFVSVGLVPLLPPSNILQNMANALGGGGLWEYVSLKIDEAEKKRSIKDDEYYLMWRLNSKLNNLWI